MGIEQEPVEAGFLEELEEYLTLSKEQVNIFADEISQLSSWCGRSDARCCRCMLHALVSGCGCWSTDENRPPAQRLYGFLYCLGLGATLSILSSLFIFNYEAFAFFYTIGNVLSLGR
jgi:hypothetical protein